MRFGGRVVKAAEKAFTLTGTDRCGFRRTGQVYAPRLAKLVSDATGGIVHERMRCYAEAHGSKPWHLDNARSEFKIALYLRGASEGGELEFNRHSSTFQPRRGDGIVYDTDTPHRMGRIEQGEHRYVVMDVELNALIDAEEESCASA